MKIKALILGCCLGMSSVVFAAANQHAYPEAENTKTQNTAKELQWPGYCEIEIINQSYDDIRVTGVFEDGTMLRPFIIYSYESPHYISLYYYGYCHRGMDLDIDSLDGYHLYGGYTRRQSSIRVVVPYLANKAKVEVQMK
jgi:hypothetical protein